ncbi:hypothetical protein B7P43_G10425 [Cryptotermes secundus]|uniref:Uncharacterized protein n=1 Tax=Cryptotermes secundus TaxID=105785 RepID=A0A2J7PHI3_9NEOP|nr:hypothetical protein B7P43_G10425 [Cryptotermes secundus]
MAVQRTCNVRSMYRAGSPVWQWAVAEEISKYKSDLAGVQKVRWDGGGIAPAGYHTFFPMERGMKIMTGFFVHKRIVSAVKRVEFVSDRISYIILKGRWCDIIVMNVHAPTKDTIDDIKDRFYEELEYVFDKFPKYPIKPCDELITRPRSPTECVRSEKTEVNGEVHGGRPRPTGAIVPREKKISN